MAYCRTSLSEFLCMAQVTVKVILDLYQQNTINRTRQRAASSPASRCRPAPSPYRPPSAARPSSPRASSAQFNTHSNCTAAARDGGCAELRLSNRAAQSPRTSLAAVLHPASQSLSSYPCPCPDAGPTRAAVHPERLLDRLQQFGQIAFGRHRRVIQLVAVCAPHARCSRPPLRAERPPAAILLLLQVY